MAQQGYSVLETAIAELRDAGVLVLADAKRGDIGTTMAAYAAAWVGDSPLACDAVTASPYLGFGSLRPLLDAAAAHGRGVFVLAATSNPEGASVQRAMTDGRTVAQSIVDDVSAENRAAACGFRGRGGRCHADRGPGPWRARRPGAGARESARRVAVRTLCAASAARRRGRCFPRCPARCCGPVPSRRRAGGGGAHARRRGLSG